MVITASVYYVNDGRHEYLNFKRYLMAISFFLNMNAIMLAMTTSMWKIKLLKKE